MRGICQRRRAALQCHPLALLAVLAGSFSMNRMFGLEVVNIVCELGCLHVYGNGFGLFVLWC